MKRALSAATFLILLGPLTLTIAPASADSDEPGGDPGISDAPITVTDEGWILYQSDLDDAGIETVEVSVDGEHLRGGGCHLSRAVEGTDDDQMVTVEEQVAYNPETCESQYLVAEVTPEAAEQMFGPAAESPEADAALGKRHIQKTQIDTGGGTSGSGPWAHYIKTWYDDPINIDITKQTVAMKWGPSTLGSHAVARDSFQGCVHGICLDQTNITSSSVDISSYSDRYVWVGVANFKNNSFGKWVAAITSEFGMAVAGWAACGFPTDFTATFHHDETVIGYKTGAWKVIWDDSKAGACTNLVDHHQVNGPSYPL